MKSPATNVELIDCGVHRPRGGPLRAWIEIKYTAATPGACGPSVHHEIWAGPTHEYVVDWPCVAEIAGDITLRKEPRVAQASISDADAMKIQREYQEMLGIHWRHLGTPCFPINTVPEVDLAAL